MANWKLTYWSVHGSQGWSTSFYHPTPSEDFQQILNDFFDNTWAILVTQTMDEGTRIGRIAISDPERPRFSYSKNISVNGGYAGSEPSRGLVVNTAINYQLDSEIGVKRLLTFRAPPYAVVAQYDSNGGPYVDPDYKAGLDAYAAHLVQKGLAVHYRAGDPETDNTPLVSVGTDELTPPLTKLFSGVGHGIGAGDLFTVGRVATDELRGLNKLWRARTVDGGNITISRPWNLLALNVFPGINAYVRKYVDNYSAVTGFNLHSVGTRDTGRPFSTHRGRS